MKKQIFVCIVLMISTVSFGQKTITQRIEERNGNVVIHVEANENGQKKVFQNTFSTAGMSDDQKQHFVQEKTDSILNQVEVGQVKIHRLNPNKLLGTKKKTTINPHLASPEKQELNSEEEVVATDNEHEQRINIDIEKQLKDFDWEGMMNSFRGALKETGEGINNHVFLNQKESSSTTIQNLRAYANKPFDNKLTIQFTANEKNTVWINITNVSGEKVASTQYNDFEGDFVGQVPLKQDTKGTLFITVTQGNDGAITRVVIK